MYIKQIILSMTVLAIVACSHAPSVGEQILAHSDESKLLGEQWKKGEALVFKGTDLKKEGKALIKSGNKNVSKGKKLVKKGKGQIHDGAAMLDESKNKITEGIALQEKSKEEFSKKYPGKLN